MKTYTDILAGLETDQWPDAPKGKPAAYMWGPVGTEELEHTNHDDAIEEAIERAQLEGVADPFVIDPDSVEVVLYERDKLTLNTRDTNDIMCSILEGFEELMDPTNYATDYITPAMTAAAEALLRVILADFEPWSCTQIETFTIDVADWRRRME